MKNKKWSIEETTLLVFLAESTTSRAKIVQEFQERFPERNESSIHNNLKKNSLKVKKAKLHYNDKVGYWLVLDRDTMATSKLQCLCTACNTTHMVRKYALEKKLTKSCGCIRSIVQKETNLEKYGVIHPMQLKKFQDKACETNVVKYGAEYSSQNQAVKQKRMKTVLDRYGVDSYSKTKEYKDRVKQTSRDKWGVENYSQTKECRSRVENTNLERYGVVNPGQLSDHQEKVKATSRKRYGTDYYLQNDENLQALKKNLLETYGVDNYAKTESFKSQIRMSNLDSNRIVQLTDGRLLGEMCKDVGASIPYVFKIYHSMGEKVVLDYLLGYEGRRTYYTTEQVFINILEDVYKNLKKWDKTPLEFKYSRRPDFRIELEGRVLYINTDGLFDHSINGRTVKGNKKYHLALGQEFRKNNHTIFQFREDELRKKPEIIKSIVMNFFGKCNKLGGRNCVIKKISNQEAREFFKQNHLMDSHPAATAYGLYHEDQLVVCMAVRKVGIKGIEISRFCTKIFTSVRGGFSKLLSHIIMQHSPTYIQSFCDMRYSTGISYEKLGFKLKSITLGWKWTDSTDTYNRMQCRANMDNRKLTQMKYAAELRWHQIYDAGQAKYIKEFYNV